ncbi:MAG: FKBP-type peptidyl-prolyl cis-trans isomerase [Paludibacteraceae bacterium]|nr:FKBP-type peptidyl-prolyl cis-trans isomerase [Paludibacteraceae bacterium]
MEKVSYALGLSIGNNLLSSGIKDVNLEKFAKGVSDVLKGANPEMSYDEAKKILDKFFKELAEKINGQNAAVGKAFLEKNKKEEGVIELPSGLQYKVLKEGNGKKPKATDKVRCHYEGMLLDGTVFDSSIKRGEPAVFGVNQVIQGWVEALQLMQEGSKWRLFIPSEMAYGARGAGNSIPPHATLIFDVELLAVES